MIDHDPCVDSLDPELTTCYRRGAERTAANEVRAKSAYTTICCVLEYIAMLTFTQHPPIPLRHEKYGRQEVAMIKYPAACAHKVLRLW